ncbi:MAG: ethyl tert-butyl ether degradation protein EthD [Rhodospirillales bacterium 20-64-7]|nr:MAG: ethyl tert-butyl ether degradation protein EthD [Rhodospirillales bacterium 20-64-7]HQT79022.1 EthD family reductase [Rhodopila sp.]
MIKVSVLYPGGPDAKFDMNYYCTSHMPMVQRTLGSACKKIAVEQGLGGGAPGSAAPYVAMGHLYFDSMADFQGGFAKHGETFMADVPNYTNVQPVIQISEVKV